MQEQDLDVMDGSDEDCNNPLSGQDPLSESKYNLMTKEKSPMESR
jgi:hypothetical protein